MATVTNYPIDLPILVIEAQIFVAVNKFQFLPNKLIPNVQMTWHLPISGDIPVRPHHGRGTVTRRDHGGWRT